MKQDPARNPSALRERASAHRAMALAALRADSSLSTRLSRYNHHMSVARALEADAAQHDLRTPTASKARHADLLNLRAHLRHMRATAALEVLGGVQP